MDMSMSKLFSFFAAYWIVSAAVLDASGVEVSRGIAFTDPAGDVESSNRSKGYLDFTGLYLSSEGDHTLRFSIETREPLPERPQNDRTWIGLYLDLDMDPATGRTTGDLGADVLVALESVPGVSGYEWRLSTATVSEVARQYDFKATLDSRTGRRLNITLTSPDAFKYYPQFNLQVYSHERGTWHDSFDRIGLAPIALFPITHLAINTPKTVVLKRHFTPRGGYYEDVSVPITDHTREVRCDLNIRAAHIDNEWKSTFTIRLEDREKDQRVEFTLALSVVDRVRGVARIRRGDDSLQPHYLEGLSNPKYVGQHQMILRFREGTVEFEIDGKVLERHPKDFTVHSAELVAVGTNVAVELAIE